MLYKFRTLITLIFVAYIHDNKNIFVHYYSVLNSSKKCSTSINMYCYYMFASQYQRHVGLTVNFSLPLQEIEGFLVYERVMKITTPDTTCAADREMMS